MPHEAGGSQQRKSSVRSQVHLIDEIKRCESDCQEGTAGEHPECWTVRNIHCTEVSRAMVMAGEFDIHFVLVKVLILDIVPREDYPKVGTPTEINRKGKHFSTKATK